MARHDTRHQWRERLESDIELELRPIRVCDVLRSLQAAALPDRGVTITLEVDETVHVAADERLLSWAIGELLHHALAFSRAGAHVLLRCRAEELGVSLELEDACGGLPREHASHLFDTADDVNGGGWSVRKAVEVMGGEIYVENFPGHGCLFALLFPPTRPKRASTLPPASGVRSALR
jgi:signal transduction histidine kinase